MAKKKDKRVDDTCQSKQKINVDSYSRHTKHNVLYTYLCQYNRNYKQHEKHSGENGRIY